METLHPPFKALIVLIYFSKENRFQIKYLTMITHQHLNFHPYSKHADACLVTEKVN